MMTSKPPFLSFSISNTSQKYAENDNDEFCLKLELIGLQLWRNAKISGWVMFKGIFI